ncbi:MAG: phosphoribosylamine--glycine ligase [Nitrosospira sp.]|nr:phosphoribosylamine--glycine ligase [Nitrosospira sp.]MDW7642745.1 phosphoribosylamine--glycine ligase [Nitrosomonadaceae bacterium]MBI0415494.1 phosphoribosylamine--glycine ligase [Nitrosospira sp.]MBI0416682.1 phosphoribosylamine--glycine ligase [Nitrosospira sp.]MBI0418195.1 phosphoribosylamine--glycine ligase [Nitrosospira sp.]
MRLLVIGGGGREHALAWKLKQSPRISKVFVAPGNAGTALEEGLENLPIITIQGLLEFAKNESIAFTVVGSEAFLAEGIVDIFRAAGLKIFGPTKQAARLETSKNYSKAFMYRHGIPTAAYETFSDPVKAHEFINHKNVPIVIKADGLAAGKGVVVAMTLTDAHLAIDAILVNRSMGSAGLKIVIEEFLEGEEVSFIVMIDGRHVLPLATSQDHKRLKDGDNGPNTGGMGAHSPAPVITLELHARIMCEVIQPVMSGMEQEGEHYTGFLYAGLMISKNGEIKVLEFNCRMGDPETQPIMLRLKSDLSVLIEHAIDEMLDKIDINWDCRVALGVVMATCGYPEMSRKGDIIHGLLDFTVTEKLKKDFYIFHAGTAIGGNNGQEIVTTGGRVLCVTALGDSVKTAQLRAYKITERIHFDGCQMRHDIGHLAID